MPAPEDPPMRHAVLLDLRGRDVLVVGGGPVAARRTAALVQEGARVRVVAPQLCEDLEALAATGAVRHERRGYQPGDVAGAWFVHTATGDRATDAAVAAEAAAARVWCVHAGDAARSTAWTPAVARAGDVTVAVSAGGDPRRAAALRSAISTLLDTGGLPLRRHRPSPGHVALIGGGPGDPDLITVRGRRLLAEADVVVADRLGPRALLDGLPHDVEGIEAGKSPHAHPLTQAQINEVLVERATAGQRVVRLKGGDPYLLGRGGEEALACRDAGISVEVVPGVTSAFAVPAAAGIPVTHRGLARQVTVVSAHDDATDWGALARLDGTLVLLMGVAHLAEHTAALISHGRSPRTPVAVVERGTLAEQRTTLGTLADIAGLAAARGVTSPAVVVVGEVVALAVELGSVDGSSAKEPGKAADEPAGGPPPRR